MCGAICVHNRPKEGYANSQDYFRPCTMDEIQFDRFGFRMVCANYERDTQASKEDG